MQLRRGLQTIRDLARGPARLCEAFGLDRRYDGLDLTGSGRLWLSGTKRSVKTGRIMRSCTDWCDRATTPLLKVFPSR